MYLKQRIFTGWTFRRGLFLIIGILMIVQAVMGKQWLGIALGAYFASMGLFAFGCAGDNCFGGSCDTLPARESTKTITDVEYEEIKIR